MLETLKPNLKTRLSISHIIQFLFTSSLHFLIKTNQLQALTLQQDRLLLDAVLLIQEAICHMNSRKVAIVLLRFLIESIPKC